MRPPWGTLNAVDLTTGSVKWKVPLGYYPALMYKGLAPTGTQNFGGCVATARGLVFKEPRQIKDSGHSGHRMDKNCGRFNCP